MLSSCGAPVRGCLISMSPGHLLHLKNLRCGDGPLSLLLMSSCLPTLTEPGLSFCSTGAKYGHFSTFLPPEGDESPRFGFVLMR
jgi:hypothetical protein